MEVILLAGIEVIVIVLFVVAIDVIRNEDRFLEEEREKRRRRSKNDK